QQAAILEDLVRNVPLEFDFLFSKSHAEVISGKQEGVYAWIGINFVLGRFDHEDEEDAVVTVALGDQGESLVRKRTVGILDMGGASLQIAYEVPDSGAFSSPQQEEAAKSLLAEFNLGCDVQHTGHVYRVYVNTFLGFGGNFARQRYEELVLNQTSVHNRAALGDNSSQSHAGNSRCPGWHSAQALPFSEPGRRYQCHSSLPSSSSLHGRLRGGHSERYVKLSPEAERLGAQVLLCREQTLPPDPRGLCRGVDPRKLGGVAMPCRIPQAEYCSQRWEVLTQRFRGGLYSAHADQHRLKYQCFKSAWMYQVLHQGFHFPLDYPSLRTAQLVYDREVQWTLGAILYKTRFLPLRDLRQESIRQAHASWLRLSFVYNHYLFFACILVVALAIVLYLLRLRRIHRRQLRSAQLTLLWLDKVVVPPGQGNGP
ncbi:PREDICTED: ectonucleoside triphosphate diphosphohydrolase 7-like, partial [Fulmarus glacialis]|uniref:ectonucleoside triphosphate diphosphohydrolase 7-like n=1 Tax=Fulmarus glacialis TaxID=30455 RepID=UPI00051BB672